MCELLEKVITDLFAPVFKLNMLFSGKFAIIVISLKNLTSFFKLQTFIFKKFFLYDSWYNWGQAHKYTIMLQNCFIQTDTARLTSRTLYPLPLEQLVRHSHSPQTWHSWHWKKVAWHLFPPLPLPRGVGGVFPLLGKMETSFQFSFSFWLSKDSLTH